MKSLPEVLENFYQEWITHNKELVGAKIKKDRQGPYLSVILQSKTPIDKQETFPTKFQGLRIIYIPAKSKRDLELGL